MKSIDVTSKYKVLKLIKINKQTNCLIIKQYDQESTH